MPVKEKKTREVRWCILGPLESNCIYKVMWEPYPSYHNELFPPLLVLEISLPEGRSISVLSKQYETSYLFYVTLSFLCNIICYLISVFAFWLVTLSEATTSGYNSASIISTSHRAEDTWKKKETNFFIKGSLNKCIIITYRPMLKSIRSRKTANFGFGENEIEF